MFYRLIMSAVVAAVILPAHQVADAATLSRDTETKREKSSIYDLGETNSQLVVSVAGLELIPDKAPHGTASESRGAALETLSEEDALNAARLHALLRRLHAAGADGKFAADTTTMDAQNAVNGGEMSDVTASEEAMAAIRSLQQSGVVAVPEPSTYALLGAGAALLALKARRRN